MLSQPLICVADVQQTSVWFQRTLGFVSAHGGPEYEQLVSNEVLVLQLHTGMPMNTCTLVVQRRSPTEMASSCGSCPSTSSKTTSVRFRQEPRCSNRSRSIRWQTTWSSGFGSQTAMWSSLLGRMANSVRSLRMPPNPSVEDHEHASLACGHPSCPTLSGKDDPRPRFGNPMLSASDRCLHDVPSRGATVVLEG